MIILALFCIVWVNWPLNSKQLICSLSEEGCTQGDVSAMALYGLGIKPLIDNLANGTDNSKCVQAWYADDSSSGGELNEMIKQLI